jgi:glucose dehydrogenase
MAAFEKMMTDLSNWGPWGKDDQLGTINLITPAKRREAAGQVTEGFSVSLARDTDTEKSVDNASPLDHKMSVGVDGEFNMDSYSVFFHGFGHTHFDALSHVFYQGRMYNGSPQTAVTSEGAKSGADSWGFSSIDPETGLIFLPTGNPTSNFYGADRIGNDLYANCIVALDAQTGKLKSYFQAIHHDIWDYDLAGAPLLVTVNHGGKKIPAVVFTSKAGLVFILNRNDGTPIYGVEEGPVPQGDAPSEQTSATQPFPVKPPPLGSMEFKPSDVAKVTPEQQKFCENLIESNGGMQNSGPFTPFGANVTLVFPGSLGAMNWCGGSYDPRLGLCLL